MRHHLFLFLLFFRHSPLALCEQIIAAIDVDHAILEHSLPLVLDARHLVVHTEDNVHLAIAILAVVVVAQLVVAVVQVRVDDLVAGKQTGSVGLGFGRIVVGNGGQPLVSLVDR